MKDSNGNYTNITLLDRPDPQTQVLTATPIENITSWSNLIPASGNLAQGHSYHYIDVNAPEVGVTYVYLLEDLDANGQSTFHWDNVVSATVGENIGEE